MARYYLCSWWNATRGQRKRPGLPVIAKKKKRWGQNRGPHNVKWLSEIGLQFAMTIRDEKFLPCLVSNFLETRRDKTGHFSSQGDNYLIWEFLISIFQDDTWARFKISFLKIEPHQIASQSLAKRSDCTFPFGLNQKSGSEPDHHL